MQLLPRNLNAQLVLLVSCILLATGAISGWVTARRQSDMLVATTREHAAIMTRNVGESSAHYLVLQDYAGLETLLRGSLEQPDLLRLQVAEPGGILVGEVGKDPGG